MRSSSCTKHRKTWWQTGSTTNTGSSRAHLVPRHTQCHKIMLPSVTLDLLDLQMKRMDCFHQRTQNINSEVAMASLTRITLLVYPERNVRKYFRIKSWRLPPDSTMSNTTSVILIIKSQNWCPQIQALSAIQDLITTKRTHCCGCPMSAILKTTKFLISTNIENVTSACIKWLTGFTITPLRRAEPRLRPLSRTAQEETKDN